MGLLYVALSYFTDTNDNSGNATDPLEQNMSSNQPIKDVHVIIEQEAPPITNTPNTGASLDLSKPIEVTNETIVIIDGKKCVLSANPDTGQLCAYPVVTPEGKVKVADSIIASCLCLVSGQLLKTQSFLVLQ